MTLISRKTEAIQKESNANRGIHSEFIEHSQQLLVSGYQADTPITVKAEASSKADSHPN